MVSLSERLTQRIPRILMVYLMYLIVYIILSMIRIVKGNYGCVVVLLELWFTVV